MEGLSDALPLSLVLALRERLSELVSLIEGLPDSEGEAVGVNPVVTVAVAL